MYGELNECQTLTHPPGNGSYVFVFKCCTIALRSVETSMQGEYLQMTGKEPDKMQGGPSIVIVHCFSVCHQRLSGCPLSTRGLYAIEHTLKSMHVNFYIRSC